MEILGSWLDFSGLDFLENVFVEIVCSDLFSGCWVMGNVFYVYGGLRVLRIDFRVRFRGYEWKG